MQLFITSLNSGSNGNCYYIGNEREAILIDAGISCRETERRMKRLGLSMQRVKAIFVSHEHSDHVSGVPMLSKKYSLPVYITPVTLRNCRYALNPIWAIPLKSYEPIIIGSLSILAFPKKHDAADAHSFTITQGNHTVGVFTDIGAPCDHVTEQFSKRHAAFLEANYCEEMLQNGFYPEYLKRRIRSDVGHLSNNQALELFLKHKSSSLKYLLLSHLSKENNTPELAKQLFERVAGNTEIIVASRYQESALYSVSHSEQLALSLF